jgi:hypothetical protein
VSEALKSVRSEAKISAIVTGDARMDEMTLIPTDEARQEAKLHPNGWVYVIKGRYGPDEAVPADAIVGCWAVDGTGTIVGAFIPNPNYRATPAPGDVS